VGVNTSRSYHNINTKEGKKVGTLSGINACKGRKIVEAVRNFGSIDMG
jgi:hypothetical protein